MNIKSLILVNNKKIEAFILRGNTFERMKFKGEKFYIGDEKDFWKSWENNCGYINKEISKVSICLISNREIPREFKEYSPSDNCWGIKEIKEFFLKLNNSNIDFIEKDGIFKASVKKEYFNIEFHEENTKDAITKHFEEKRLEEQKELERLAKIEEEKRLEKERELERLAHLEEEKRQEIQRKLEIKREKEKQAKIEEEKRLERLNSRSAIADFYIRKTEELKKN